MSTGPVVKVVLVSHGPGAASWRADSLAPVPQPRQLQLCSAHSPGSDSCSHVSASLREGLVDAAGGALGGFHALELRGFMSIFSLRWLSSRIERDLSEMKREMFKGDDDLYTVLELCLGS